MSLLTAVRETLSGFKSLVTGMRITAREAAKPSITVQYPRETLPMPARFRGHIRLVLDPETGKPICNACTLCMKACPSNCILLDGLKREGDKKKSVSKYLLDFTKCSLCGSCVEICPSDAITFSREYNVVSLNRDTFSHMDLYAKVETEARKWAETHPQPVATPVAATPPVPATVATPPVPAAAAASAATPPAPIAAAPAAPAATAIAAASPQPTAPKAP
jgi:NADH-quinone oxidoreductase subunit I